MDATVDGLCGVLPGIGNNCELNAQCRECAGGGEAVFSFSCFCDGPSFSFMSLWLTTVNHNS